MDLVKHKNSPYKTSSFILEAFLLGLLFFIPSFLCSSDTGLKYYKNYGYREYDHQAQNWGMVQTENRIIYVANQGGVLQFDGVSWRLINVPNYTVRSIAVSPKGTVYLGGNNDFGYLTSDHLGSLHYRSLRDHIKDNIKNFSKVWSTHWFKGGAFFRTTYYLFRWDPDSGQIKTWRPKYPIYGSYTCNGELFVWLKNAGLMKMKDGSLAAIPCGEPFGAVSKIFMIAPYDTQRIIIGTLPKGFFIYDGNNIEPFPTEADGYLNQNKAYKGIRLSNGDFALATLHGGLVILNGNGHLKFILDKSSGLQDDDVKYVFQDAGGNLWLCLNKGISKIEYASPVSIHDERSHLNGIVLTAARHNKRLYAGTTNGIFFLESPLNFQQVPGISSYCWSLLSMDDSLLAATSQGIFHIKGNKGEKIIDDLCFILTSSTRFPQHVWCGTKYGLTAISRKNNRWSEEHRFETIRNEIRSIAEAPEGNLWLFTSAGGVIKVDFPGSLHQPVVTTFDASHGLPGGQVYIAVAADHVMFATEKGMFCYDEVQNRFVRDTALVPGFAGGPGANGIFRFAEDCRKNIWLHSQSRNYQAVPGAALGELYTVQPGPLHRIPTTQVNAVYPDPDGNTVWFASVEGLIRYGITENPNHHKQNFPTLIRKVVVNKKLVFDGDKNNFKAETLDSPFCFDYKNRNLYFEFAAPFFEAETETRYRCLLEGYDDEWSAWEKDTKRNYTNLDAGEYTFRVQAKNVYQHPGTEDIFTFEILAPWYKTWWASLFFGIGLLLFIILVVKWRSTQQRKEKQKLEHTIKMRTREINEKNQQLEKQTVKLKEQSEKLEDMDRAKSRFFTNISHEFRTPLTLIMNPLEQMLEECRNNEQKQKLQVMLQSSQRVLTLINQLLDLARFDSGKMKLKTAGKDIVSFSKGVLASFSIPARQKKLELEFYTSEETITLYFDSQKMEAVMYNLLTNAVKFTPGGGKITLLVSGDEGGAPGFVKISVKDTGIGISKEELKYIFNRFYQVDSPGGKKHEGTGIGLALMKEIVLLHHGRIDVHSREGKGTEFVIQLPMGHEHLAPDEIESSPHPPEDYIKPIPPIIPPTAGEDEGKGGQAEKHETREKNIILVVEDNADVRKYIREPLEAFYTVVEAADGKEGTAKAKEIIPDLIVSDIMMPEMDGCELCREVKADINTSHIPVILLTAKAAEENIIQGLETGADDYITKPFNTRILMTRIKNLIALRRRMQLKIQGEKMLLPDEIPVSSMDETFIRDVRGIIEKNLSKPGFGVELLSKKLYMDRTTVFRKIKALTGETPTLFIRSYRLNRAKQLLRDKFGNVSEVSLEVGFSNTAYFAKLFKEKFQQSPSAYQSQEPH